MADAENVLPPSKKRAAGRELSRDNPGLDDEEDTSEQETGTFKKASNEVLATRRMVKVRRQQTTSGPSSNPFAGIRLVPLTEPSVTPAETAPEANTAGEKPVSEALGGENNVCDKQKDENDKQPENKTDEPEAESAAGVENAAEKNGETVNEAAGSEKSSEIVNEAAGPEADDEKAAEVDKTEKEDLKENVGEDKDSSEETARFSSFQQLSSSQNAFTGLAGSGFSGSTFSFGSTVVKDGFVLGASSGSPSKNEQPYPSFGFGLPNNGNSSVFGTRGVSIVSKNGGSFPSMREVPVETGEENEKAVYQADSVLYEFIDGSWKERGKGELKVNVSTSGTERARLVMRARGNYRLILNASLYPDMKLTNMDKKGITFTCMNSTGEGKDGFSTFALKFKDVSIVEEFRAAVMAHKDKVPAASKTPESASVAASEMPEAAATMDSKTPETATASNTQEVATALKTPENSPKASSD
ncbi:nuclear pore complex protein NUP50A-like [Malania oleifera]|uniref:nuclear pore complex protein NUP50A-like n=1 Tax=Malania oleifera TaxID=397392 RepID=UPI0025ADF804|nr:nuclear pore complex protein NUP50A-like [Malania oleifera]